MSISLLFMNNIFKKRLHPLFGDPLVASTQGVFEGAVQFVVESFGCTQYLRLNIKNNSNKLLSFVLGAAVGSAVGLSVGSSGGSPVNSSMYSFHVVFSYDF